MASMTAAPGSLPPVRAIPPAFAAWRTRCRCTGAPTATKSRILNLRSERWQAGTGLIPAGEPHPELAEPNAGRSEDLDALAAYALSLQFKPSPWTATVERGRTIFNRADVGCAGCHPAPRYTDSTLNVSPYVLHNVGTGDGPGERMGPAFDTPSLRGIWYTAPYLHDGSAPGLRDVLITRNPGDRHGRTSNLSESEIADLIAFLKSL